MTTGREAALVIMAATTALLVPLPRTAPAEQTGLSEHSPAAHAEGATCTAHASYERKGTLQETMLAIRQRYSAWVVEQPAARKGVEFGLWRTTPPLPSADAAKAIRPAEGIDANAKGEDG